jgi:ribonuclease III
VARTPAVKRSSSKSDRFAVTDLEVALGFTFSDRDLLELALAHRSWAFEAGRVATNERLEFLGDAVLGVVVTDQVFHMLPDAPEGRLAKLRSAVVSSASLAVVARRLGVGAAVKLGKGEERSGGRDKESILADTLEALIGAVYLDEGMTAADTVVRRHFGGLIEDMAKHGASLDFKTALQELTAGHMATLPNYEVSGEGPDHQKEFTAVALIDGQPVGKGKGRNKKEAEQQAAREAIETLAERTGGTTRLPSDPSAGRSGGDVAAGGSSGSSGSGGDGPQRPDGADVGTG